MNKNILKCDFCGKLAQYYLSERTTYNLYSLEDNESFNENEWEDDTKEIHYCKECAEAEGII